MAAAACCAAATAACAAAAAVDEMQLQLQRRLHCAELLLAGGEAAAHVRAHQQRDQLYLNLVVFL